MPGRAQDLEAVGWSWFPANPIDRRLRGGYTRRILSRGGQVTPQEVDPSRIEMP